jgi:hypothetical protein
LEKSQRDFNHPARRCRASGYAGLIVSTIPSTLKGLNQTPDSITIASCRNHSQRFWCIRFPQPKTAARFCAINQSAKNYTAIMSFPGWLFAACLIATLSYYGLEKPLRGLRAYFRKAGIPK